MLYSNVDFSKLSNSDNLIRSIAGIYDFLNKGDWTIDGLFKVGNVWFSVSKFNLITINIQRVLKEKFQRHSDTFFPEETTFNMTYERLTIDIGICYRAYPSFIKMALSSKDFSEYQILYYELNGKQYQTSLPFKIDLARVLGLIQY